MNSRKLLLNGYRRARTVRAWLAVCCSFYFIAAQAPVSAQTPDKYYYWVTPYPSPQVANRYESFVVEIGAAKKPQFDAAIARGAVVFDGQIAAGPAPYNKNYYAPGHPVWNWHFVSIDNIDTRGEAPPGCISIYSNNCESHPSEIAANPEAWIAQNGTYYFPTKYVILGPALSPNDRAAVANVSNRGMTGAGEKALITGFIIKGGEPRNVVVRALGPSMSAAGVQQPAGNPKIDVYQGSRQIGSNADWKTDPRATSLSQSYPALAPTNDREAALLLTLMPGTYTLHGLNDDGTEGVVLLEAYDVDSAQ